MFGLVSVSGQELAKEQLDRYKSVYCGICRSIGAQDGQLCRLGLSYDMAFLALVLMSLYEPEEQQETARCVRHPRGKQIWIDNEYIRYAARMNVALACRNAQDDWEDDGKWSAWLLMKIFSGKDGDAGKDYPRQRKAIAQALSLLSDLERENCPNPDLPANAFGTLLGELMVYREDLWAEDLRLMGYHLGRFIYLADGLVDYRADKKEGKYNPFLAMGGEEDLENWERYLVLAMAGCAEAFERLPLVQDKALLDNIVYSGVWVNYRAKQGKKREERHD